MGGEGNKEMTIINVLHGVVCDRWRGENFLQVDLKNINKIIRLRCHSGNQDDNLKIS